MLTKAETERRKTPGYQGGFLLDGGMHWMAGMRLLLGESSKPTTVSAFTSLSKPYLAPVDTVHGIWQTISGASGTISASHGSPLCAREYTVACENGSVTLSPDGEVTVRRGDEPDCQITKKSFPDERGDVRREVAAWAQGILDGKPDPKQSPEEALADLELMEAMLQSGEQLGKPQTLQYQI